MSNREDLIEVKTSSIRRCPPSSSSSFSTFASFQLILTDLRSMIVLTRVMILILIIVSKTVRECMDPVEDLNLNIQDRNRRYRNEDHVRDMKKGMIL